VQQVGFDSLAMCHSFLIGNSHMVWWLEARKKYINFF